jgi:hypothetical protein
MKKNEKVQERVCYKVQGSAYNHYFCVIDSQIYGQQTFRRWFQGQMTPIRHDEAVLRSLTRSNKEFLLNHGFLYRINNTTPSTMVGRVSGTYPDDMTTYNVVERDIPRMFSPMYASTITYEGLHSYHEHHGGTMNESLREMPAQYKFGVELEVEFPNSTSRDKFLRDARSNHVYFETDGSLSSYGIECITVPLHPQDAKSVDYWEPLCELLTRYGARSWSHSSCGLHVHVSRTILDDSSENENLGKLLFFYEHFLADNELNIKIFGRSRTYSGRDGKTEVSNAAKLLGSEVLRGGVKDKVKDALIGHHRCERYFEINIRNANTIEFRKGKGSISPQRIVSVIEWCELITLYCKQESWTRLSLERFLTYVHSHVGKDSPLKGFLHQDN